MHPEKTTLLTQNHSPLCSKAAGRPSQHRYSHNQNGSAKEISPDPKGKLVGSPEAVQRSREGTRRSGNYLGNNGHTSELQSTSSSLIEAQCAKLSICSDEAESILLYDDGDTSSSEETLSEVEPLLTELIDDILGRLLMPEVLQLRPELGKAFRNAIHRPAFLRNRPESEGEYSPSFFMTDDVGDLHWYGFDTLLRKWTRLPSLNFAKKILPSPDPDLFKDYLMAGDGGLLCINVGKATGCEKLVVCNPLTGQVKVLPPLKYPRHPVLMHLRVDHDTGHYKVVVAGSASIGTDELSLKTEEYDSRKGVWECPDGSDLPCPPFGLNEYQNGVYLKDSERELLMCVAIIDTRGRGVLVYDIVTKKWAQGPDVKLLHIPLVRSEPNVSHLATTQIVGCGGSVFVFSEQECGRDVYFLIHKLILEGSGDFTWDEVTRHKRTGGRGLLVYPEFTCVPVSEHELCIFNTVEHTIEIVDLINPTEVTPLQCSPTIKGNRFHSLNPIGFVFKPSFRSVVCPKGQTLKVREICSECEREDPDSITSDLRMDDVCKINQSPSTVMARTRVDKSVPTNETDKTENLVEHVGTPIKNPDRHRCACAKAGEENLSRSWDENPIRGAVAAK